MSAEARCIFAPGFLLFEKRTNYNNLDKWAVFCIFGVTFRRLVCLNI